MVTTNLPSKVFALFANVLVKPFVFRTNAVSNSDLANDEKLSSIRFVQQPLDCDEQILRLESMETEE